MKNPFEKDWAKIKDPIERDLAFRTTRMNIYCRLCGGQIIESHQDEHGLKSDLEFELANEVHYVCMMNEQQRRYEEEMKRRRGK